MISALQFDDLFNSAQIGLWHAYCTTMIDPIFTIMMNSIYTFTCIIDPILTIMIDHDGMDADQSSCRCVPDWS